VSIAPFRFPSLNTSDAPVQPRQRLPADPEQFRLPAPVPLRAVDRAGSEGRIGMQWAEKGPAPNIEVNEKTKCGSRRSETGLFEIGF
jgi:hypothetical protein